MFSCQWFLGRWIRLGVYLRGFRPRTQSISYFEPSPERSRFFVVGSLGATIEPKVGPNLHTAPYEYERQLGSVVIMVSPEEVVGKADVGFYPKEKPGMGQALKGQLILTNRRLVYVRFPGGKYLTAKAKDYSGNIQEGLGNEGSFEISLDMIVEAKADRVWGTPYFRLRYRTPMGEKVCALVFVSSMNMMAVGGVLGLVKSPYEQLARAIEQLKAAYKPT